MSNVDNVDLTEKNVTKIREIIRKLKTIVPEVTENVCWIERSYCQYGCDGSLSSIPLSYCLHCHRFDYALYNQELFDELWEMWRDDLQEKVFRKINEKKTTVWRILGNLVEEGKDQLGDQMYQVMSYFLKLLDENFELDDIDVAFVEDLDELELIKESGQVELVVE